jgi:hypothetical protein
VSLSYEGLLLLAAAAFYLYDSALLLHADEVVFVGSTRAWTYREASSYEITGRYVYLPNPLRPWDGLFRVALSPQRPMEEDNQASALAEFMMRMRPLRWLAAMLLALLVAGLPLVLFRYRGSAGVSIFLLLMYSVLTAIAVELYRLRRPFGISFATATRLAFEALACPPLGINIVRKLALAHGIPGDPVRFARSHFAPALFASLVARVSARIDEELAFQPPPPGARSEMLAYRERLSAMVR